MAARKGTPSRLNDSASVTGRTCSGDERLDRQHGPSIWLSHSSALTSRRYPRRIALRESPELDGFLDDVLEAWRIVRRERHLQS